jgi:Icc-related predicted phosphoesterase
MHAIIDAKSLSSAQDALRIVVLSDTHEYHREVTIPDGDLLIHAGDITRHSFSSRVVKDFDDWLSRLPHRYKVVIPGNHDYSFVDPTWRSLITHAVLLINDGVELLGLKLWGTPITPVDYGNFCAETAADREAQFKRIPDITDLLISHGPPYGILDREQVSATPQGCRELLREVNRVKPVLHVFGHIHGGYGMYRSGRTVFVNAAVAGRNGRPLNKPHLIDIRHADR